MDVPTAKTVLEELGGNPEGLIMEGVCLAILREVLRRLPYICVDYMNICMDLELLIDISEV